MCQVSRRASRVFTPCPAAIATFSPASRRSRSSHTAGGGYVATNSRIHTIPVRTA